MVDLPATLEPSVKVSWDGTGAFDGEHDDVTDFTDPSSGVSIDEGLNGNRELNPPKITTSSVTLLNSDGRFSQDRADSPVYQRVLPGRQVEVTARHGVDHKYREHVKYRDHIPYRGKALYTLLLANIDDLDPSTGFGNQKVRLPLLGTEHLLTDEISVPVMVAPRVSDAIHAVLDAHNWPADKRNIAVSDSVLLYFFVDARPGWTVLLELLGAEGPGAMFVKGGVFHFQNRNYRATAARSTTSRALLFDRIDGARTKYRSHLKYRDHRLYRGRTSGLFFTDLKPETGFKNVVNHATYATKRRALGSLTTIWSLGTALDFDPGQTRRLVARPTSGNPFQDAVTPTSPTDFTVSGGTVSVSLDADSGLVGFITITATSGAPTVSGLQLRAKLLAVVSETTVENTIDASASIAKFSPIPGRNIARPMAINGYAEMDIPNAEAVCDAWVGRYMAPRPAVTITLEAADAAHLRLMLGGLVSDRWTLIEANTGLSADVWINSKKLTISGAGGRKVVAVIGCEKVEDLAGFEWDDPSSIWNAAVWGT